jgi:hypothetical protein
VEDYTFELMNILNAVEYEQLISDVDILRDAPNKFLNEVAKLESLADFHERGKEAEKYINENGGLKAIAYEELIAGLASPSSQPLSFWRQLYLLERSIPPRKDAKQVSWFERLKIFADTYKLEHAVLGKKLDGLPGKLLFTRKSGDHDNLHAGAGAYAADFYCWDDKANKFHSFIEFKHWGTTDILRAADFYKDKHYFADYVLLFTSEHKYYLIDYINDQIIEQTNLSVPKLLYW